MYAVGNGAQVCMLNRVFEDLGVAECEARALDGVIA